MDWVRFETPLPTPIWLDTTPNMFLFLPTIKMRNDSYNLEQEPEFPSTPMRPQRLLVAFQQSESHNKRALANVLLRASRLH